MGQMESIRELAEPIVGSAGLDLWDVEVSGALVRVLVDRPAGVDLDALAQASRALSAALDEHPDLVPSGRYDLEVSSPGIERTLRTPDQYRRYEGSEVAVKVSAPVDGSRRLRGTLVEVGPSAIALAPEGQADQRLTVSYSNIQKAHIVVAWGPTPPPGRASTTARARSRAGAQRGSVNAGTRSAPGSAPEPKDA